MATYKQIGLGAEGNEVQTLQSMLNKNGYQVDEDGVYGQQTRDAVADYQKKNNLTVSGTADDVTWAGLTSGNDNTQTTPQDDAVTQAQALLQQQMQNKPGPYQSQWKDQLNDTVEQILNRDKFSYDVNEDMLYQQMVDQYALQGQLAMLDTMGHAQAMTGGYGNSYAQNVGQQVYQGYLREAADRLPEFYKMALDQYDREGNALREQYALMGQQEERDYGRYRDQLADHYAEMDRLQNRYSEERAYDYQQNRDQETDRKWQAEYDEAVRQWEYAQGISDADGNRITKPAYSYTPAPQPQDGADVTEQPVDGVAATAAGFDNNDDLANYLDGQVNSGTITADQADALYGQYVKPETVMQPQTPAQTQQETPKNNYLEWLAKSIVENFPNFGR